MTLESLRSTFESNLLLAVERMGEKNPLRDACEYALTLGGKRLRPLIVLMTAEALGLGLDVMPAALSIEFFHTASLIADDLPCMDNDDERRGRPSLHKAFGESVAILASYALIAAGYGGIYQNGERMKAYPRFSSQADSASLCCLEVVTRCAGMQGATYGQFLDLFSTDSSFEAIQRIVHQKTATLFEVAFLFGWLFGGGNLSACKALRDCAFHLGMAFQIADDLEDDDPTRPRSFNAVKALGRERARAIFGKEIVSFGEGLKQLGLWTPPFQELFALLNSRQSLFASCGLRNERGS